MKYWKNKEFSILDQQAIPAAESAFRDSLGGVEIDKLTFKKDNISILSVVIKNGKYDPPTNSDSTKIAFLEVCLGANKTALITCTEKTSEPSNVSNFFSRLFGVSKKTETNPRDIMYVKIEDQKEVEKMVGKKDIPLWNRQIASKGRCFFIVAINRSGSSVKKFGKVDEMNEEDILKALTGFDSISRKPLELATKICPVDYGKESDGKFDAGLLRCKNFLYCDNTDPKHRERYTHACRFGDRCTDQSPQHRRLNFHARPSCKNGRGCMNEDAEHRMTYHGEVKPICNYNPCRDYGRTEHMKEFLHGPHPAKFISFDGLSTESGFVPDFDENVRMWEKRLGDYLGARDMRGNENFRQISDWMKHFQPVHQCSGRALASIAKVGVIASLTKLRSMWENPRDIAHVVWMQDSGSALLKRLCADAEESRYSTAKKYASMYCRVLQAERSPKIVK